MRRRKKRRSRRRSRRGKVKIFTCLAGGNEKGADFTTTASP